MKSKKIILGVLVIVCFLLGGVFLFDKSIKNTYALDLTMEDDWYAFTGVYIPKNLSAAPGEKVNVELYADSSKWEYISLGFRSTTSTTSEKTFVVYLKNIHTSNVNNPAYFIMPTLEDSVDGEVYELRSVHLFSENFSKSYYTYHVDNGPFMNPGEKKYVTYKSGQTEDNSKNMTINKFKILNNNAALGEKVYIDFDYTSSKKVSGCSLWFKNVVYGNVLYYGLSDFSTKPYLFLDTYTVGSQIYSFGTAIPGDYKITGMTCFYDEGGNEYFTSDQTLDAENFTYFDFGENLVIREDLQNVYSGFKLYGFELLNKEASIGDNVQAYLTTNVDPTSILLSFYNKSTNEVLPVYLKGLEKRYFVIPSTTAAGDYELQYILIEDADHSYTLLNNNGVVELYQDSVLTTNKIDITFDDVLKIIDNGSVNENNKLTYLFNIEDYNESIKNEIINLEDNAVITVVSDNQTLIPKGLFEAIRETRKTLIINYKESEWVFNGADIEEPKDIDVALFISDITSNNFEGSFISKLPEKTKLLNFSNNGQLPGKVLIRLKSIELDNLFEEDDLYIYYYKKDEDNLYKVAMEIQKSYGYYEFYINHNSKYLLSNEELDGNYVSEETTLLELNSSTGDINKETVDNNNYYFYILIGIIVVILIIFILFFLKKNKNK